MIPDPDRTSGSRSSGSAGEASSSWTAGRRSARRTAPKSISRISRSGDEDGEAGLAVSKWAGRVAYYLIMLFVLVAAVAVAAWAV